MYVCICVFMCASINMGVALNNDSRGYVDGWDHLCRIISLEHFLTGGFMGGVNPPENDFQFDVTDVPDLFSHVAMS